eukprot:jgi/Undpi1/2256/HiC_scaffold_13.g05642.m1
MQASMDSETVREQLDELGEELQTVASLVQLSIKNQQHEGVDEASGAFDCSGDAERKFEDLKAQVQTLARVLDGNGSSLASLTADSLADVNRLADQASRCKSAISALDGLCQAEKHLTSSHHLLAKNDYVQAADAVASADALLADLQRAEAESTKGGGRRAEGGRGSGVDKENRRNTAGMIYLELCGTGVENGVLRALKRLLLKRRAGLESHLRDLANASVELRKDGTTVRCRKVFSGYLCERHFRSPVPLAAVFDALGRLGQLDVLFSELSKRLREEVIGPLLSARYVPPPKRVTSEEMASLTYAPAEPRAAPAGPTKAMAKRSDGGGGSGGGGSDGSGGGGAFDDASAAEASEVVTEILARVSVVLEFMHEEVLGGQRHLTAVLGDRLLPEAGGLSKALLGKLDEHVPNSAHHLADFETGTRDACQEFENRLESMGYFGDEGGDGTEAAGSKAWAVRRSLSRFVGTLDGRFAAKRRRTLLGQARDMALGDYHNTVQVPDALEGSGMLENPGAELLSAQAPPAGDAEKGRKQDSSGVKTFRLEACQVSRVAKAFVALVRATLTEACSDEVPPHCAKELFRTARDMLDLFRAVIPVQHANALEGVPRIAAVFQNDCLYLAHHMVTMGHEFRKGLPPPANQTATMVDTVPLFRELAAQSLSEQQRRQQQQLEEFFAGVDVLASTETSAPLTEPADSAFEGIFPGDDAKTVPGGKGGLGVDKGWMGAGRKGGGQGGGGEEGEAIAYGGGAGEEGRAAAAVRKSVYHLRQLRQAWWKVLPDRAYTRVMGALVSLVAGKVCTPVLAAKDLGEEQTYALHRIFKSLEEAADDIFESSGDANQHTPGWTKAVVVGQMMELGLEAIGERLQGDFFRPLSADELCGLVRAVFQETPARTAVLTAIGQG